MAIEICDPTPLVYGRNNVCQMSCRRERSVMVTSEVGASGAQHSNNGLVLCGR